MMTALLSNLVHQRLLLLDLDRLDKRGTNELIPQERDKLFCFGISGMCNDKEIGRRLQS